MATLLLPLLSWLLNVIFSVRLKHNAIESASEKRQSSILLLSVGLQLSEREERWRRRLEKIALSLSLFLSPFCFSFRILRSLCYAVCFACVRFYLTHSLVCCQRIELCVNEKKRIEKLRVLWFVSTATLGREWERDCWLFLGADWLIDEWMNVVVFLELLLPNEFEYLNDVFFVNILCK
jgi:predicted membrane protein